MDVKDSNGNLLSDGDSVLLIKDLKLKGSSTVLKRGTVYKKIRLTSNPEEIEVREGKGTLVLKAAFLSFSSFGDTVGEPPALRKEWT